MFYSVLPAILCILKGEIYDFIIIGYCGYWFIDGAFCSS